MKSILIATDHSKGAENAVKYAKKIAKAKNQKLIYLHVINLPIADSSLSANLLSNTIDDLKADAAEVFEKKIKEDAEQGIQSEYKLSFNDILETINQIGETEEIDLVAIGRTGHRTFLDKILGSTAESLLNKVKYPLLVVPEDYSGEIFQQLAYATQLQFSENTYIEKTLDWKPFTENKIILAHILEKFPLNTQPTQQFVDSIDKKFDSNFYELKNFESDFFSSGMLEMVDDTSISLLFLTTHKRGFLEGIIEPSKTKNLVNKSTIPLVIYSFEDK